MIRTLLFQITFQILRKWKNILSQYNLNFDPDTRLLFYCSREEKKPFQPTSVAYKEQWISPTKDWRESRGSLTTLHTTKSHIFNSICLRLPDQHKTIERKTIILLRTNKEWWKMEQGWNGEKRPSSEAQGRDAGNKFRNGRVREMGRKRGWPLSGSQPRNITGYSWPNLREFGGATVHR